jgi:heat shock protein HtpX
MAAAGVVHLEREPVRAYPPHVTFRNLIDENRRKSSLLVALVVGIGIAVGGAAGAMLGAGGGGSAEALIPAILSGAVAFGVIATIASVWSLNSGSNVILSMAGARPIEKKDDPQLFNVVEELAIAGGMPLPKVYLIDDPSLNAFATGRDPEHAAVAITTGLRRALTRDELAGVMAHELAHIRHYDIRLMMLMATLVGLIVIVADVVRRMIFMGGMRGGGRSAGGGKGGNPAMAIAMIVGLVVVILAPIVATIVRFAISRQREYLADAGAVELTRYPQGLIGALEKLGACRVPLQRRNDAIAPLFIVNPAKDAVMNARQNASSVFSTHPPLSDRIARLKALL